MPGAADNQPSSAAPPGAQKAGSAGVPTIIGLVFDLLKEVVSRVLTATVQNSLQNRGK